MDYLTYCLACCLSSKIANRQKGLKMTDEAPSKRGRPPNAKLPEQKRRGFNFRMTEKARQQLVDAVKISGRSLAAEMEYRLNVSFVYEAVIGDVRDYEQRAKRAIDIQAGRVDPPGKFLTEEEAAAPPRPMMPPALRDEIRHMLKEAVKDAFDEAGILRWKGAA